MMRSRQAWALWVALMPAVLLGAVELPAPLRDEPRGLRPLGAATLRWFGLHIYDTALYVPEASYTLRGTAALSIQYNISIKCERLLDTTLKEWRRLGQGDEAQRTQWIKQLRPLWPDLKSGDRLTAFKRESGPTQFYFDDRFLGEISDPAFGPAFFAIWLDPNCRYPEVRKKLLSGEKKERKGIIP